MSKRLHIDTVRALVNRHQLSAGDSVLAMLAAEVLERREAETKADADDVLTALRADADVEGIDQRLLERVIAAVRSVPNMIVDERGIRVSRTIMDATPMGAGRAMRYMIEVQAFHYPPPEIA